MVEVPKINLPESVLSDVRWLSDDKMGVSATIDGYPYSLIPSDPMNAHWRQVQKWIDAGNEPDPALIPLEATPNEISDVQFFMELAFRGIISQDDALAAVKTGTLPAQMEALIDQLPEQMRFEARMRASGDTKFRRNSPITQAIAQGFQWNETQLEEFWAEAAQR